MLRIFTMSLLLFCAVSPVLAGDPHAHEDDIIVGRTLGGMLAIEFDQGETLTLAPISGLLNGWGSDEPGFLSLDEDEPAEDFYMIEAGADIRFEVISFDPGLKGWTQGFAQVFDDPTEQFVMGAAPFDEHPFWHIDSDDAAFDPSDSPWTATGRLVDAGSTGYAPSDPFTLTFVPEPASGLLLMVALGAACRRRRRFTTN